MTRVVGRYAPSPSGDLHLGSLLAALGSFLQARAQGGRWVLRIDDLDPARVVPGADRRIKQTLRAFGLQWDGMPLYQSERWPAHARALAMLWQTGHMFECGCTRREARKGCAGIEGPVYPGTCRNGLPAGRSPRSLRVRVDGSTICFADRTRGRYKQHLADDIGDFVVRRADAVVSYQLATVVDDAAQGVTEVVRGGDLLTSTPRQIFLQRCLALPEVDYAHLPLLVDASGRKLSKSGGAWSVAADDIPGQIWRCLWWLGQQPPDALRDRSAARLLDWAVDNWSLERVPPVAGLNSER